MEAKITINMDSSAFKEAGHQELSRILRDLADDLRIGTDEKLLVDRNGNSVGKFSIEQ